ncbi:MAG: hypothetical protein ABJC63_09475 [Gemmatimonadales bacterium]
MKRITITGGSGFVRRMLREGLSGSGYDIDAFEASFPNPIYGVSHEALEFVHAALIDGWRGYAEVVLPTLLSEGGFVWSIWVVTESSLRLLPEINRIPRVRQQAGI